MNLAKYISKDRRDMVQVFFDGKLIGEFETLKIEKTPIYEIGNTAPRSFSGSGQLTINRLNLQR